MACRDGRDCIKCVVYFLNIFLFILGIGIAGVAGYVAFNKSSALHNAIAAANLPGTMTGLYIMFAGGLVIAVVAILTCMATSAENRLLLWLTFFLVLLLLIMQLVGVILCFYKYKVVEKNLTTLLKESVALSSLSSNSGLSAFASLLRAVIGKLESTKKCCGLNGPADYGSHVPNSCRPPSTHKRSSPKGDSRLEEGVIETRDEGIDEEKAVGGQGSGTDAITAKSSTASKTITSSSTQKSSVTTRPTTTTTIETMSTPSRTTSAKTLTSTFNSTTVVTENLTTATTKAIHRVTTTSVLPAPYSTGCFQRFKPIIAAAGGVGISVLIAEFVLLIFIGLLLCDVGKEYDRLA